ncbi:MAG: FIST C-terminal domain-containing protein [Oscillospiraceae bacterium]|nr:FIST C-terminal domain-containing protein [Oscillospiraceae bacterium]
MIKSYVITIDEIDDAADAAELFREKLAGLKLCKNSFGIIHAHADSVHSGVYDAVCAVCKEAGLQLAGIACNLQSSNEQIGANMFSVMILTGDELEFVCSHLSEVTGVQKDCEASVRDGYNAVRQKIKGAPKLCLLYTAFAENRFPCEYIDVITSMSPGLPVFGGVSYAESTYGLHDEVGEEDDVTPQSGHFTLCNGKSSPDSAVIVLISGDIAPQFFISTFVEESLCAKDIGIVTECDRNKLSKINNVNAADFLQKFGFDKNIESSYENMDAGFKTTAFVFECDCEIDCDCDDGSGCRVSRQNITRTPVEIVNDEVICAGYIKKGAKISLAVSTPELVIGSARETINALKDSGAKTVLLYSCEGRKIGLYAKPMDELLAIREGLLSEGVNYLAAYVGGEICPTTCAISQKADNNEHNQTLIACVF